MKIVRMLCVVYMHVALSFSLYGKSLFSQKARTLNKINGLKGVGQYRNRQVLPMSNTFSNYFLRAYMLQDISQLYRPEFFISLFSHFLNVRTINDTYIIRDDKPFLDIKYINKNKEEVREFVEVFEHFDLSSSVEDFYKQVFDTHHEQIMFLLENMDFVATLKFYKERAQVQTASKIAGSEFDVFLDYHSTLTEKLTVFQEIVNNALSVTDQDFLLRNENFWELSGQEAQDYYKRALKGDVDDHAILMTQTIAEEISIAFNTLQVFEDIYELFSKKEVQLLTSRYQTLILEFLKMQLNDFNKLTALLENSELMFGLLSGQVLEENDLEEWLATYSNVRPESEVLLNVQNAETKLEKMHKIFQAYDIDCNDEVCQACVDFLKVLRDYKAHPASYRKINYNGLLLEENIEAQYHPTKIHYIMWASDEALRFDYTVFASHVNPAQQATVISLLGGFTDEQEQTLKTLLNPRELNGANDYTGSMEDIFTYSSPIAELGYKSVPEFIKSVSENAFDHTTTSGQTLWDAWLDGLQNRYYELADKWDHDSVHLLRLWFETEQFPKIYKQQPIGLHPIISFISEEDLTGAKFV